MKKRKLNRREFIGAAAAASIGFTVVPRNVIGGQGYVPPSDRLTLAYIGCGTQGLREMAPLLANKSVQIVSVCDPNKFTTDYVDWSQNDVRNTIRRTLGNETWGENFKGIPGGRDIGLEFVNRYYAKVMEKDSYRSCSSYEDYRELLEKEKDLDAVKIMTPDHLHGHIAIAAMKKGKHVVTHKPIANRMNEARMAIEMSAKEGISTHLLAWSDRPDNLLIKNWITNGSIGTLKEIHNWSNRPVWPQWQENPAESTGVPPGMNWQLWLGPVPDRPYHPNYTHAVFRGWYDFGAGSIADMGHYSLFPLFLALGINTPAKSAEAYGTTTCKLVGNVATGVKNTVAFPPSCMIKFRFDARKELPAFDLFWYDGGMKPFISNESGLDSDDLPREAMMFVGDKGLILAGFRGESPRLYSGGKLLDKKEESKQTKQVVDGNEIWINAFRNVSQSPGSFRYAGPVTETILLGGVALRAGKKVVYDASDMKITNLPEANQFLTREYRNGWEL